MNTPLIQFLTDYQSKNAARFHMPGHKGRLNDMTSAFDITEIDGADVLYDAQGIIEESERNASALFDSSHTFYSTEGSSLCIRAMVALCVMYAKKLGKRPKILAGRNAHASFLSACALSDASVHWLFGENITLLSCQLTENDLIRAFKECENEPPVAVYITTPDYLGNMQELKGFAEICHRNGALLLVDNAHGAYLNFLPDNHHPLAFGADLVCDSAHKTLPALTGCSYLHVGKAAPTPLLSWVRQTLKLFASTSPSYLLMASLDLLNATLSNSYKEKLAELCNRCLLMKKKLREKGFLVRGDEPIKITLLPKQIGYTGIELKDYAASHGITCEYADPDHTVFMLSCSNTADELDKLERVMLMLPERTPITIFPPVISKGDSVISLRSAVFSPCKEVDAMNAEGMILAKPSVSCPPAVPIGICGEIITKQMISAFHYYGINKVSVIDA